jgi:hypothetical protein
VWRQCVVQKGKHDRVVERSVGPCETCHGDLRAAFGCGWDGLSGQAVAPDNRGIEIPDDMRRTCAEYYARQPAVASVWDELADYKRGALGHAHDLPAPLLACLRMLEAECSELEAHITSKLHGQRD